MQTLKDLWLTIKKHPIIISYIICTAIFASYVYGCQPKVKSLLENSTMVSRPELMAEIDFFLANARARINELDQKEAFIKAIFEFTSTSIETGQFNPSGLLVTLLGILGAGTIGNYAGKTTAANKLNNTNPPGP